MLKKKQPGTLLTYSLAPLSGCVVCEEKKTKLNNEVSKSLKKIISIPLRMKFIVSEANVARVIGLKGLTLKYVTNFVRNFSQDIALSFTFIYSIDVTRHFSREPSLSAFLMTFRFSSSDIDSRGNHAF